MINTELVNSLCRKLADGEFKNPEEYKGWREDKDQSVKYHNAETALELRFKLAALEAVGLREHPKADRIYKHAWDKGHSGGFADVLSELIEVADLFHDD